MKSLFKNKLLRAVALPVLRLLSFDIMLRHHWTDQKFLLNTYLHKGYWAYGKRREKETLLLYKDIIGDGQTIVEVGGHIGYFTLYFRELVGPLGQVFVFEPGQNNLMYIRSNTAHQNNIHLIEKAVGNKNDENVTFYLDSITGQNNSMIKDFKGLIANMEYAMVNKSVVSSVQVEMTTIDSFCQRSKIYPDFVKIDVEGYEHEVLEGMHETLRNNPIIMVEVQRKQELLYDLITSYGYQLFSIHRKQVDKSYLAQCSVENIFCLHPQKHRKLIKHNFSRI